MRKHLMPVRTAYNKKSGNSTDNVVMRKESGSTVGVNAIWFSLCEKR